MKKMIFALYASLIFLAACTKSKQESTDYGIYGLHDATIVNNGYGAISLPLSITYTGPSANLHEQIKLSVSGLPEHLYLDSTWVTSGYPPFTTTLSLYGDPSALVMPGGYLITLTASSEHMGPKTLQFDVVVPYPPSCTAGLLGKYYSCHSYCTGISYTDSIYADPLVINKIWFSNFNNSGQPAYAMFDCYSKEVSLPPQEINGVMYSGGNLCLYDHKLNFPINYGSDWCVIDMY